MTLGELIPAIGQVSADPAALRLIELLETWRAGSSNADELRRSVERYLGNSWIASAEEHKSIYALWSTFRDQCINGLGGMTMNERLYCFDLFSAWDQARTEEARNVVRLKVDFPASSDAT